MAKNFTLKFVKFQNSRYAWLGIFLAFLGMVILAHSFFQLYLYMPPCEQCVYIRFAMLVISLAGLIVAINPRSLILKILGFAFGIYGAVSGIKFCLRLNKIHHAIHGDDPFAMFGLQGCSLNPSFPFNLPLHEWYPSMFLPAGDCGYDAPIIPDGATLSKVQSFFTTFYADGWYLLPSKNFLNMAEASLIPFSVVLILLLIILFAFIFSRFKKI